MAYIKQLSYLIFESAKLAEWETYATDFLGMEATQSDGLLKIRMDDNAWRFIVRPGDSDDLWAAGFQVANATALRMLEADLVGKGVEVRHATPQELLERNVQGMIWLQDPEGLRIEVVYNPLKLTAPVQTPLIPGGFITGELGLGHIAICAADLDLCEAFYRDVLGFKLSDYIVQDIQGIPIHFTFFHVNPRHHSLALAGIPAPARLNHLMVEVRSLDVVGQALERAKQQDIPIYMALGRHPNDQMLSFYANTPSNFAIEIGMDGTLINDEASWEVSTYSALSTWGHKD